MPGDLVAAGRGRRRPGHRRRTPRAHDGRPARQPAQPDASAVPVRAVSTTTRDGGFTLREFYRASSPASACCWPTMCGIPGRRSRGARRSSSGGRRQRSSRPSRSTTAWRRSSTLGVPNIALAEYKAPENYRAARLSALQGGRADHAILTQCRFSYRRTRPTSVEASAAGADRAAVDLRAIHAHRPMPDALPVAQKARRSAATGSGPDCPTASRKRLSLAGDRSTICR